MEILLKVISGILIISGVIFMLISAIGLIRLPDFYIRVSAGTKATTFGIGLILAGIVIYYNNIEVLFEILAILFFVVLISPLSAHVVARAAFLNDISFWEKTDLEEIKSFEEEAGKGRKGDKTLGDDEDRNNLK